MLLKKSNEPKDENSAARRKFLHPRAGLAESLTGEKSFAAKLYPFLPADMIGGSIPNVPGMEEEAVWNAASQACETEKVYFTYTAEGGKIWYLACPAASLASNPDSWCPLAAALPGNSEFWDKETVYLYEQEGQASALRWDPETGRMQVFLGATRTILPRVQSMDANFVTINPEVATIVPWRNRMLKTEKMSRMVAMALVLSGLAVNIAAVLILVFTLASIGFLDRNLQEVKKQTDQAALDLMRNAANVMQSDTIKHMVRIQNLLDSLAVVNSYLVKYEVLEGKVTWQAIVPQAFANKVTEQNGGATVIGKEAGDNVRMSGNN